MNWLAGDQPDHIATAVNSDVVVLGVDKDREYRRIGTRRTASMISEPPIPRP